MYLFKGKIDTSDIFKINNEFNATQELRKKLFFYCNCFIIRTNTFLQKQLPRSALIVKGVLKISSKFIGEISCKFAA